MALTMKFIIPAKRDSLRVKNKNWKDFHDGESLVDITIGKLVNEGVKHQDIYLSCECEEMSGVATRWGINFLQRSKALCNNGVPLTQWIREITAQVEDDDDIAWCQVCDPLFDEHLDCIVEWDRVNHDHDSLVVCYPWRGYLMTNESQPIGWSFGDHHTPSQKLPHFRTMPFTMSILKREAIAATGYHVGRTPFWYEATGQHIDIDTEQDFALAQIIYKEGHLKPQQ